MYEPLHEGVIVRLLEEGSKTESGIVLPDSSDPMFAVGEVVEVSNKVASKTRTPDMGDDELVTVLKKGDKVVFALYATAKVRGNGIEDFLLVKFEDILAKVK